MSHGVESCSRRPANGILAALPPNELGRVATRLELTHLAPRQILYGANVPIRTVYFLESGMVSLVARLERGGVIEIGIVGSEGMVGLPLVLGVDSSPHETLVQTRAMALCMGADALKEELDRCPVLRVLLLRYEFALRAQIEQTAACNGRHSIEKRLARWLLMARDRLDLDTDELPLTQELLATMLGVRRAGVTSAVGALQRAGIVSFSKGRIVILDRRRLENTSCECHEAIRREYEKLGLVVAAKRSGCAAGAAVHTRWTASTGPGVG